MQAGQGTKEFLLGWKEGKTSSAGRGKIVIRLRTQSQAGLGCSEPWPSPLLPIPLSPAMFLAYAYCEQRMQSASFFLPTWPERRWAPSIVSAPSSLCPEYPTCHPLLWVGGHGSWAKQARFPPSTAPPGLVPHSPSLPSIPRNKGQSLCLRQGSLVFFW